MNTASFKPSKPTEIAGPFTAERLLQIAVEAEAQHEELCKIAPPGTIHDGRNNARRLMEDAQVAAQWMEGLGLKELSHVGSFGVIPFKKGTKVRIRAGAVIRSMHPSKGGMITLTRARVVTLHDVYNGYVDAGNYHGSRHDTPEEALKKRVRQPEIVWSGAGGYWCHADITDVEAA